MNIIPQISLFEDSIFENLGDLERLQMVLNTVNDAKLIGKLYKISRTMIPGYCELNAAKTAEYLLL